GLVCPVRPQHFHCAQRLAVPIPGRVDAANRPAAERLEQLVAWNPWRCLHGSDLEAKGKWRRRENRALCVLSVDVSDVLKCKCHFPDRAWPGRAQCTSSGMSSSASSVVTSAFKGGRKNKKRMAAATNAIAAGTRNSFRKSVTAAGPVPVVNAASSKPPEKLPTIGPRPRIRKLNSPWALERASLGKNSSTKIYTVAKKKA